MEVQSDGHPQPQTPQLIASTDALQALQDDVQYLWTNNGTIPVYDEPLSPLDFLRNHVAVSRPCIIRNAILQENGTPLHMTLDDLAEQHSELKLQVDVTPDGHGDCLRQVEVPSSTEHKTNTRQVFVKPMEVKMTISDFCRHLRNGRRNQNEKDVECSHKSRLDAVKSRVFPSSDPCLDNQRVLDDGNDKDLIHHPTPDILDQSVLYFSRQNDCLRQELTPLWNLTCLHDHRSDGVVFPRSFEWAEQAFFGSNSDHHELDAVNLWMGDERAVSAMHKDHYENLFYVLSGEKVFSLCPPSDAPFLYEQQVISGRFEMTDDTTRSLNGTNDEHLTTEWCVSLDMNDEHVDNAGERQYSKVHWIASDPFFNRHEQHEDFPLLQYTHPIPHVRVKAGELLYLPSLWFHRVTQTCETIGINYWYDMNFESPLWCYFHFLQQLETKNAKQDEWDPTTL